MLRQIEYNFDDCTVRFTHTANGFYNVETTNFETTIADESTRWNPTIRNAETLRVLFLRKLGYGQQRRKAA